MKHSAQSSTPTSDVLSLFCAPVRTWFQETFAAPTPPQEQGWPPIHRGEHVLLLSPTGSGKTLAAFLCGIDRIFRELTELRPNPGTSPPTPPSLQQEHRRPAAGAARPGAAPQSDHREEQTLRGIHLVYISPLKALNNDIERNLRAPLAGIKRASARAEAEATTGGDPSPATEAAEWAGLSPAAGTAAGRMWWPDIRTAVRSGDTPTRERRAILASPPHILITTPESLYLMLTSPRARELFRTVHTVIVDEIHTLAGNKRGVHLALSLERLQHLAEGRVQRIGLSATAQPLHEVARFLGGNEWMADNHDSPTGSLCKETASSLRPRPVRIIDAGRRKPLDLCVETVVPGFRNLPGDSIWPTLVARMSRLIHEHRTTLIFANNRRLAERTADRLNEQRAAEARGESGALMEMGVAIGAGFTALGKGDHENPIRAHHGSMSREIRLEMEQDLKAGRLDALVGTSSLQLGIDIGSVDLVVQLGSPKAVSEGLQRVGRSGHLVGQTSTGRIFPLHREDLMEAAVIAGGMLRGEVEDTPTPHAPLDVLAQQVVASVATDSWHADDLFHLIRQAYPYEGLTPAVFHNVLDMLAGRYPSTTHRALRARLSWDRVNGVLAALPGSRLQAVTNPGTITDRGSFGAFLPDRKTRIGELDEEFVFETRVGDTFMLGAQVWRVLEITDDRVIVGEAPGFTPRMPFWRGDYPWRPYELGYRVGAFRREVAERLRDLKDRLGVKSCRAALHQALDAAKETRASSHLETLRIWLATEYALDAPSTDTILDYIAAQLDGIGTIASDNTIVLEAFHDPLGDARLVIHSPFGGRVNGPWALALAEILHDHTGAQIEAQTNDDGILLHVPDSDVALPLDIVTALTPQDARRRILAGLPESAVFGAQFRQNATRALLLPGLRGGRRTPFWLQRLRARDLLQTVKAFPDFPILLETYRDCLEDVMDLPHLERVLEGIQRGEIQTVVVDSPTPSPAAQSLMRDFITVHLYEWDAPRAERRFHDLALNLDLLQELLRDVDLSQLLKPEALHEVESRLRHTDPGTKARTADELAVLLEEAGDLSSHEAAERSAGDSFSWLARLAQAGRIGEVLIPTPHGPESRWITTEDRHTYETAFALEDADVAKPDILREAAARRVLERFLAGSGPVTLDTILHRYAVPREWVSRLLDDLVSSRHLAHGHFTPSTPAWTHSEEPISQQAPLNDEYVDAHVLQQLHRHSLHLLRREIKAVPLSAYAVFLAEWQHATPGTQLEDITGLRCVLQQLRALPVPAVVWERDVLPARLRLYKPTHLDQLATAGELVWACTGGAASGRTRLIFLLRGEETALLPPGDPEQVGGIARAVHGHLHREGAAFSAEVAGGLGLSIAQAEAALLELMLAGLVTNDDIDVARRFLLGPDIPLQPTEPRIPSLHLYGRPPRRELRAAKQRVRCRLEQEEARIRTGRWALLHRWDTGDPQSAAPEETDLQTRLSQDRLLQTHLLLARYGVLTPAAIDRETAGWEWSLLFPVLKRLELRGEVRRGYFVHGLPGPQFALPDAVELLRETAARIAKPISDGTPEPTVLNACDPANIYGPAVAVRIPSTWIVLDGGFPTLVAADSGSRLTSPQEAEPHAIQAALATLLHYLRKIQPLTTVSEWNGVNVSQSPWREYLTAAGFYPDDPSMSWDGW